MGSSKVNTDFPSEQKFSPRLLRAVQNGDLKKAIALIENGADLTFQDQSGLSILHVVALKGYDKLVIKIYLRYKAKELEDDFKNEMTRTDQNGETAIHKAARGGHINTLVALMAFGGLDYLNQLNNQGQSALELSVIREDKCMLQLLCKFGAEPTLIDWVGPTITRDSKSGRKRADEILDLLIQQNDLLSGFQYGSIRFGVWYLIPSNGYKFDKLDITIIKDSSWHFPYFVYCCKTDPAYLSTMKNLKEADDTFFSDVIELTTFGKKPPRLQLEVSVNWHPARNETLHIVQTNLRNDVHIEQTWEDKEKNQHKVLINLLLQTDSVTFCIVKKEVKEVFVVSDEAMKIQPEMEPGAEIDIPENTYPEKGFIGVNVSYTDNILSDDQRMAEPVLISNVLSLSMPDNPQKAIKMTLPLQEDTKNELTVNDLTVIRCSEDMPTDAESWKELKVPLVKREKSVAFEIMTEETFDYEKRENTCQEHSHFAIVQKSRDGHSNAQNATFPGNGAQVATKDATSHFGAQVVTQDATSSRYGIQVATQDATFPRYGAQVATQVTRKEYSVEIFTMTKNIGNGVFKIVVECANKSDGNKRREFWANEGFKVQSPEFEDVLVSSGQEIQIISPESLNYFGQSQTAFEFYSGKDSCYKIFQLKYKIEHSTNHIKGDTTSNNTEDERITRETDSITNTTEGITKFTHENATINTIEGITTITKENTTTNTIEGITELTNENATSNTIEGITKVPKENATRNIIDGITTITKENVTTNTIEVITTITKEKATTNTIDGITTITKQNATTNTIEGITTFTKKNATTNTIEGITTLTKENATTNTIEDSAKNSIKDVATKQDIKNYIDFKIPTGLEIIVKKKHHATKSSANGIEKQETGTKGNTKRRKKSCPGFCISFLFHHGETISKEMEVYQVDPALEELAKLPIVLEPDHPGPPQDVSLSRVTDNTATLDWQPPKSLDNATKYIVLYVEHMHANRKTPQQLSVTDTYVELTELIPNTQYDVGIISKNYAGQSSEAAVIGFTTCDKPKSNPETEKRESNEEESDLIKYDETMETELKTAIDSTPQTVTSTVENTTLLEL